MEEDYQNLIDGLVRRGVLQDPDIVEAFRAVQRSDFMLEPYRSAAGEDRPFPILAGQTISQPYTVGLMLEWLQPGLGQSVLDVGAGSGWTAGLLGHIVGNQGKVVGTERIKELVDFATDNLQAYQFDHVSIKHTPSQIGYPDGAPYDRILVSAAADEFPDTLRQQLADNGLLVVPVGNDIIVYDAATDSQQIHSGFSFVPLKT